METIAQKLEKASNGVFFFLLSMACERGLLLGLLSLYLKKLTPLGDMRVYMEVFGGVEAKNHKWRWRIFIFFFLLLLSL